MRKSNKIMSSILLLYLALILQDLDGVEEFIRENHVKLVAIGEVRECHLPEVSTLFLQ